MKKQILSRVFLALSITTLISWPFQISAETPESTEKLSTEERLALTEQRLAESEQRILELERKLEQVLGFSQADSASAPDPATSTPPSLEVPGAEVEAQMAMASAVDTSAATGETTVESDDLLGDVREKHQLLTREELVSDDFPASWPMFGTNTRMKIGGYLKADMVVDLDGTLDGTQFLMRTIPVEGTPEYGGDPYVDFFARETRINLDIRRNAPGSPPLRGFIEGDFFSDGDNFRLRHAYITAGNFILGQTWTTLSFLEAMPFMIDFAAGDALFGGRASQIRYQHSLDDRWKFSVALEELQFLGIQNANLLPGKATSQFPLLALRADHRLDNGLLLMGVSLGQLHWDGGLEGPSDSAVQLSAVFAGRHNLAQNAYATWHFSYTEGGGENIISFAGTDANAVLGADGTLDTFSSFSSLLGIGYNWTPTWSSNLSYAYGWLDTPDSRDPLALKRGGIGHINLIWKPTERFSAGAEFMWGVTRVQNDALGKAQRFQFMGKYEF